MYHGMAFDGSPQTVHMLSSHLKTAVRNFSRHKFISFVNVFGLAVGLASCLLIVLYVLHELSYDKYNERPESIYRVTRIFRSPESDAVSLHLGTVAPPVGPLLKHEFPQVQQMTQLLGTSNLSFRYGEKIFSERDAYFADENLFNIFRVKVLKGNARTALSEPFSIMLSEEIAEKYFGTEDPLNKVIRLDSRRDFKVSGVYASFPANAHFHPSALLSFKTLNDPDIYGADNLRTNWGNNSFFTYLRLSPGTDAKQLEKRFPAFLDKVFVEPGSTVKPSTWTSLTLQKLTDIHLYSHLDSEAEENGDIKRVYIFSAIAFFILLIACINYMNLATARSSLRAKEIGVRKVVGAERREIIYQFLSESVFISLLGMAAAVLLAMLCLPLLNNASGIRLSFEALGHPVWIAALVGVPVIVGILSGIYPSLYMSSFVPARVLKGLFNAGGSVVSLRKVLVTIQFSISIILLIATIVVFRQLSYMQNKPLGFNKEHIITVPYTDALNERFDGFRTALLSNPFIKNVTRSSRIPSGRLLDANGSSIDKGDSLRPTNADIKYVAVDENFISTYGIDVREGRMFSRAFGLDTSAFMINEAAVKVLGLSSNRDAIGKNFRYGENSGKIIGVINDFNFESLTQKIVPLVLLFPKSEGNYGRISLKIDGRQTTAAIAQLERTWKQFLPETAFEYTFMDENFDRLYVAQQRQGTIFSIFSTIAIFIACLGLFGLSSFTISQRIKEIGIRKVLGANVQTIVYLLSKEFMTLVLIAALIAFPIAWYAMNNWLDDFAYRTHISWWIFACAATLAAIIALGTIAVLTFKAAISNPIKSLRSE
jgi:putative ABC transport system permease protein